MPLTANDSGRITTQPSVPSGSSMPPELAQLIAAQMAGGAGTSTGGGSPVRIRLNAGPATREVRLEGRGWRTVDTGNAKTFSTIDEAVNSFFLMDDEYRKQVMEKLYYYGLTDGPNNEAQAVSAWAKAVQMAAGYQAAGKDVDPLDLLPRMTNLKAGQLGNQPRTQTTRSFATLDPETAKVWIRQAFQASMGRDPHDAEIRQFIGKLREGFKANPTVIQQTTDADGNQTVRQLSAGWDESTAQSFIANRMANDPEGAAHQAAGTLYPALIEALNSPV